LRSCASSSAGSSAPSGSWARPACLALLVDPIAEEAVTVAVVPACVVNIPVDGAHKMWLAGGVPWRGGRGRCGAARGGRRSGGGEKGADAIGCAASRLFFFLAATVQMRLGVVRLSGPRQVVVVGEELFQQFFLGPEADGEEAGGDFFVTLTLKAAPGDKEPFGGLDFLHGAHELVNVGAADWRVLDFTWTQRRGVPKPRASAPATMSTPPSAPSGLR